MQELDLFRADAGQLEHLQQSWRHRLAKLVEVRQPPRRHECRDLRLERIADAANVADGLVRNDLFEVAFELRDRPRRIVVRPALEVVLAFQREQRANFIEHSRHFVFRHRYFPQMKRPQPRGGMLAEAFGHSKETEST